MAIILASSSPRRRQLLEQVGLSFTVVTSEVEEKNCQGSSPAQTATLLAEKKALAVAAKAEADDIVIGADTIVVVDNQVFGKPDHPSQAREMLHILSGRCHQVMTGIAVVKGKSVWSDVQVTQVIFRNLKPDEIERYIASGEPADKAGGYAIQGLGVLLVEKIEGCYTNVVGLPLVTLSRLLIKAGVRML
ncbi:Maf family protein [Acetonema longum]|uniref:dTTP/UTP pyrophosphatase n=1 Tax=Acetonema longum DSM 6540 TaxID=1009370 RepID=F7NHN6_9FIRM|nr:nucleoside triphosphate pyrophosphatase [Acetonema longum]EGO64411.1 maf protein [Acetonema longum DSM 6540]